MVRHKGSPTQERKGKLPQYCPGFSSASGYLLGGCSSEKELDFSCIRFGPGNVKTAVTSFPDIGRFVSCIIADSRTINQDVSCWGEEISFDEVYSLADRVSGQKLSDLIVLVRNPVLIYSSEI